MLESIWKRFQSRITFGFGDRCLARGFFLSRMGFPREIQCDNGTLFYSHLTTEFFRRFGIKVTHSSITTRNPSSRRFHRTLKRLLSTFYNQGGLGEKTFPATSLAFAGDAPEAQGFSLGIGTGKI
ncbi:hypothetical protein AVEN_120714-1 [Araneus ventricosus]|uniref:Integrase catalytic domain-containing protein n=1 Tax=Araneus ventricosus TaxID=182803 RepID=A0A4Y2SWR4_ARAVE|nr:hypothetical protein AVEN_120714-1 [Araneus ventricosus]